MKKAAAVAGAQVSPPSSSHEEHITKNTTTSILFQLLSATFLSNHPDLDSAHNHLISFLSGSSSDGGDKDGNHHDQDIDRFHKAYQKVIQDTKIFGRSPSTTSPQDLSLNLINELTLRYQTAIELQKKSEYLSSWTLSPQYWGKDYQDLLEKDQNIKESLRKLYEIRSHERIHQIPPYNERMIRYRRKYRGIKLIWNSTPMKSLMPLVDYSPLSLELNSTKLLRYGSFFIRKGGDLDADNDINAGVIIDGYAVGFGVSSNSISEVDASWVVFQHLQDLCSIPNSSSLYPPPILTENIQSNSVSPMVSFVFETPHLPSLVKYSSIMGMSLAANLRKYPLILRRWCSQLGAAYHELKSLSHIKLKTPSIDDVFIGEDGSLLLGNLLSVNERTSSAHSPQQFLEFIHSFLSTALDLSRYITLSLSPDNSHGVILTPDWNISVLSQEEILNAHSPYPVSYSLSLSCQSSLYVTLENLPIGTHNLSSTQYPIYTPLKTSHHYYKFHSKRMLASPSSKVKRKAHIYQKGALAMQPLPTKLGDMTPNIPYAGSPSRLLPGDLVILYGDDTESNILKIKEFHWPRKFLSLDHGEREYQLEIESLHPGLCFIHFYIICQSNSSLSHMIPDHQPIDSYPALLRSQFEPEQYLSHLFTLSIHVKAYEYPPISSSVGTTELISTVEMALNSSIHDNIPTKEVVVCSKYLLTETSDIDRDECRKQWKDIHMLLFDENSSIPPPLSEREREAQLNARKDRIDSMLEVADEEFKESQPTRKEKTNKETKAWKLGYL